MVPHANSYLLLPSLVVVITTSRCAVDMLLLTPATPVSSRLLRWERVDPEASHELSWTPLVFSAELPTMPLLLRTYSTSTDTLSTGTTENTASYATTTATLAASDKTKRRRCRRHSSGTTVEGALAAVRGALVTWLLACAHNGGGRWSCDTSRAGRSEPQAALGGWGDTHCRPGVFRQSRTGGP